MAKSNIYITNINRLLKDVKSDVLANFIYVDGKGMVITTNKVTANLNLNIIKKYIKNVDNININKVLSPRLSQSKSYLKILGISYYIKDINLLVIADIVERVIQTTHIFNNTVLTSQPHIIKASPKSDMTVIYVNIWDSKSGSKTKSIINRCFNIRCHIATVQETNINPGVPQCKNCWK